MGVSQWQPHNDSGVAIQQIVNEYINKQLENIFHCSGSKNNTTESADDSNQNDQQPRKFISWSDRCSPYIKRYDTNCTVQFTENWSTIINNKLSDHQYVFDSSKPVDNPKLARITTFYQYENYKQCNKQVNLTSAQYHVQLDELYKSMNTLWSNKQYMNALQLVIHLVSHLSLNYTELHNRNHSVYDYYSVKYITITNVCNQFSDMIYQRILNKNHTPLQSSYSVNDISVNTGETASNYIYRIYEIRSNYIRLYIEICLLRIYRFIYKTNEIVERIKYMVCAIHSISDVVVASYLRLYLTERIVSLAQSYQLSNNNLPDPPPPQSKVLLRSYYPLVVQNYTELIDRLHSKHNNPGSAAPIDPAALDHVLYPVYDYIIDVIGLHSKFNDYIAVWAMYTAQCHHSYHILCCIINYFHSTIITQHSMELIQYVNENYTTNNVQLVKLLYKIGNKLSLATNTNTTQHFHLINYVYSIINQQHSLRTYLQLNSVYIRHLLYTMQWREINIFMYSLYDKVKHDSHGIKADTDNNYLYDILHKCITKQYFNEMVTNQTYHKLQLYLNQSNQIKLIQHMLHCIQQYNRLLDDVQLVAVLLRGLNQLQTHHQLTDTILIDLIDRIQYHSNDQFSLRYNQLIELQQLCQPYPGVLYSILHKIQQLCYECHSCSTDGMISVIYHVYHGRSQLTDHKQHIDTIIHSLCIMLKYNTLNELYIQQLKYIINYVFNQSPVDALNTMIIMSYCIIYARSDDKSILYYLNKYMSLSLGAAQWNDTSISLPVKQSCIQSLYYCIVGVWSMQYSNLNTDECNELSQWITSVNKLVLNILKQHTSTTQTQYIHSIIDILVDLLQWNDRIKQYIIELLDKCIVIDPNELPSIIDALYRVDREYSQFIASRYVKPIQ